MIAGRFENLERQAKKTSSALETSIIRLDYSDVDETLLPSLKAIWKAGEVMGGGGGLGAQATVCRVR